MLAYFCTIVDFGIAVARLLGFVAGGSGRGRFWGGILRKIRIRGERFVGGLEGLCRREIGLNTAYKEVCHYQCGTCAWVARRALTRLSRRWPHPVADFSVTLTPPVAVARPLGWAVYPSDGERFL